MSIKRSGGSAAGLGSGIQVVAVDYSALTNTAAGGAGAWGQWGTEELRFTEFDGMDVTVKADLSGYIQGFQGSNDGRYTQIQISLDDGSTWTNTGGSFMKPNAGNVSTTRHGVSVTLGYSGTVDTAVQIRARLMRETSTYASTWYYGALTAVVVGT